jgi:hypothetical protein
MTIPASNALITVVQERHATLFFVPALLSTVSGVDDIADNSTY